jgi:hypothetical protein
MFTSFCRLVKELGEPLFTTTGGLIAGISLAVYKSNEYECDENTRLTTLALISIGAVGAMFCAWTGNHRRRFYKEMNVVQYQLTSTTRHMGTIESIARMASTYVMGLCSGAGFVAVGTENLKRCPNSMLIYPYALIAIGGGFIAINIALNEKARRLGNRCAQIVPVAKVTPDMVKDYSRPKNAGEAEQIDDDTKEIAVQIKY